MRERASWEVLNEYVSRARLALEDCGFFLPCSRTPGFDVGAAGAPRPGRGTGRPGGAETGAETRDATNTARAEFWSPSPSQSDFIRELRETDTAKLPSADTPYPEADPNASTFRSKNPPLSPERTIAYVALADPAPGTSLDQRCEQIRAEIEAEHARIEKNGTPQGKEAVAAACVNVWARHEGARLAGMLDPKSDVYQQRLAHARRQEARGDRSAN